MEQSVLHKPPITRLYTRIRTTWPRGPCIQIRIARYPDLLAIPQAFLAGSGHNTIAFVQDLVQHCVNEPGQIANLAQLGLSLVDVPPVDRTLEFAPSAEGVEFTWATGPDGRYHARPPNPDEPFDDTASLRPSEVTDLQVNRVVFTQFSIQAHTKS